MLNMLQAFQTHAVDQNRNIFVATPMMYAVRTSDNLETIDVKAIESHGGHNMMEVDSMHAAIETQTPKSLQHP